MTGGCREEGCERGTESGAGVQVDFHARGGGWQLSPGNNLVPTENLAMDSSTPKRRGFSSVLSNHNNDGEDA